MGPFRKHLKLMKENTGYSWDYMRAVIGAIRGVVEQDYNPTTRQLHIELLPGTIKQVVFNEIETVIGATIQNDKNNSKIELSVGAVPGTDIRPGDGDPDTMDMVHTVLGSDLIDTILITWTNTSNEVNGFNELPDGEFIAAGDGVVSSFPEI